MNFYETVRDALRTKHYAYRTEKTYMHWIRQYVRFIQPTHPREAGADGARRFLTYLATERRVSAATQNQALAALLFVYKLYGIEIGDLDIVRAFQSTLPVKGATSAGTNHRDEPGGFNPRSP